VENCVENVNFSTVAFCRTYRKAALSTAYVEKGCEKVKKTVENSKNPITTRFFQQIGDFSCVKAENVL
jgi:hypothetical protein